MRLFIDHVATKQAMAEVLNSLVGGTSALYATSGEQVKAAISMLVDNAVAAGEIRLDLDPLDLLRAIAGVASASANNRLGRGRQASCGHPYRRGAHSGRVIFRQTSESRCLERVAPPTARLCSGVR